MIAPLAIVLPVGRPAVLASAPRNRSGVKARSTIMAGTCWSSPRPTSWSRECASTSPAYPGALDSEPARARPYAPPCGPALLVTQCHLRTHALQQTLCAARLGSPVQEVQ